MGRLLQNSQPGLICTSFEKGFIVASGPQDDLIALLQGHCSLHENTFQHVLRIVPTVAAAWETTVSEFRK